MTRLIGSLQFIGQKSTNIDQAFIDILAYSFTIQTITNNINTCITFAEHNELEIQ